MSVPVLPHRRDLRQGDLVFPEEILRIGHKLDFQFDCVSEQVQREVFGPELDTGKLGDWLDLYAAYDVALQDVADHVDVTLCRNNGEEEHPFTYPLNRAERDILRGEMEACCQRRTGRSLARQYQHLLAEAGVPEEIAIQMIGHANVKMIHEVYLHLNDRMLQEAALRVNTHLAELG